MRFALSGCLATLVAAFASFYFGPVSKGDAILMSTLEQEAVFGAATHDPGQCTTGSESNEEGECYTESGSAYSCFAGNDYCDEQRNIVFCSEQISFYDPTRCRPKTYGSGSCSDDDTNPSDPNPNPPITCYITENCFCEEIGENQWACTQEVGGTPSAYYTVQCRLTP